MATHEVEVKPYGTKNEVETRVYPTSSSSTSRSEGDSLKPPYGQKNETTQQTTSFGVGSRTDVEVKPFGTQEIRDTGMQKPQRVATTTTTVRPLSNVDWRNPLLATLLGITLALSLLSLSYLPRAVSGLWHWGTSWTHWGTNQKSYDESLTKSYMHDMAQPKASNVYKSAMDTMNTAKERVETTGETLYERAKHTGENIYNSAKDTVLPSSSMTQDAKRAACQVADRAAHAACDGVDMSQYSASRMMPEAPNMNQVKDAAYDASNRASGIYEQAKQKVVDVVEGVKDTVTYPINAASERLHTTRETVVQTGNDIADQARDATYSTLQGAKDRVDGTAAQVSQAAKDTLHGAENLASSALHAAKDTVLGAGQAAKDTVLGAGQAAKDTVLGAGQAAKDTVVGAGQGVKNMASNAAQGAKDTVRGAASSEHVDTTTHRGPTRVKVEVQEL